MKKKLTGGRTGRLVGTAAGIGIGAAVGSGIGIATAGFGMAATIPLAAVGGYIGYKAGKVLDRAIDKWSVARTIRKGPGWD